MIVFHYIQIAILIAEGQSEIVCTVGKQP